jgi:hypothetical protein
MMIMLSARGSGPTQSSGFALVGAGGAFTINDVIAGDYEVSLASDGAADDLYISAIRMGATDVLVEGVRIGEGTTDLLDVILKANGGKAECTVKNDTGEATPEAFVILVPDAPRQRQIPLYGTCITQANGTCVISGVTPGEYHAYAFPADAGIDYRDPDELKPFEGHGKAVKFAEGDRIEIELKPEPVE